MDHRNESRSGWRADPPMNAITSRAGVSGLALHHIGLLVRDVDEAAKHYSGLLGYEIESAAIDDPLQTARVLFLRQPGAASWLELIAPLGSSSKLSNMLAKGGGLHHLCYETSDIDEAMEALRDQGCMVVGQPVPAQAFPGLRIAWLMDRQRFLFELLEAGNGVLSLASLHP